MANNLVVNVNPTFNLGAFSEQLANIYRQKGYNTNVVYFNGSTMLAIEKGLGGINTVLGLGQGIKVNCFLSGNVLTLTYFEEEWTSKIIGIAVGWFLCLIPFVTGIIGAYNQYALPNNISADARMIAMNM